MRYDDDRETRVGAPRMTIKQVAADLKELERDVNTRFDRINDRLQRLETLIEKRLDRLDTRLWGIAFLIVGAAVANYFRVFM